jgi:histidine ammonia-lyase
VLEIGDRLRPEDVVAVALAGAPVSLAPLARERVRAARQLVEELVAAKRPVYGITTGFGKFSDVIISADETEDLQRNLLMSHAAGVGDPLDEAATRAVMLLRAHALALGHSGIRPETLDLLLGMLNAGVLPVIPEQGSLGASGDLAPLAHMSLVLAGMGEACYQGVRLHGQEALRRAGLKPVDLGAKEGLALINGTQVMTGIGVLAYQQARELLKAADIAGALTGEALGAIPDAWDDRIHALRLHPGQQHTAAVLRRLVEGSALTTRPGEIRIQDAYSLRCIPQVHGASRTALDHVGSVLGGEINAVTDNPLIFPDDGDVLSGGNFHGQPVALALDYMGIAVAELANISERRIERLVNPQLSGLPAFLTANGGLNSGMMIVQYTAASLVSENKGLAHPASVDSIPSSANQEDHVSMGTIGARKGRRIVENTLRVLAIELLCAAQAVEFTDPRGLGRGSREAYKAIRQRVAPLEGDRILAPDIEEVVRLIRTGELIRAVEAAAGPLA